MGPKRRFLGWVLVLLLAGLALLLFRLFGGGIFVGDTGVRLRFGTYTNSFFQDGELWASTGFDGPTGTMISGQVFGIRVSKDRILKLGVIEDPIEARRRRLSWDAEDLVKALGSRDDFLAALAGERLVEKGSVSVKEIPDILRICPGSEMRERVLQELCRIGGSHSVPFLLEGLRSPDPGIKTVAAAALGKLGTNAAVAVPELSRNLKTSDPGLLIATARALQEVDPRDHGTAALLIPLLTNQNTETVVSVCEALGMLGTNAAAATTELVQLLHQEDPEVARVAAESLGRIGATSAIPALIQALDRGDFGLRVSAVRALGDLGPQAREAIPQLVELANEQRTAHVAAMALAQIGREAVPALISLYESKKGFGRLMSCQAFAKMGTNAVDACSTLIRTLENPGGRPVRLEVWALGQMAPASSEALPQLAKLLNSEDRSLQVRAAQVIWKLNRQTNAVVPVMVQALKEIDARPIRTSSGDMMGETAEEIAVKVLDQVGPIVQELLPEYPALRQRVVKLSNMGTESSRFRLLPE